MKSQKPKLDAKVRLWGTRAERKGLSRKRIRQTNVAEVNEEMRELLRVEFEKGLQSVLDEVC